MAYLSAEFGLHESLPIYSGGLGVLAGDHLKSASDLGLPLVAVGLFYRESYFRQRIDRDGCQHAEYIRSSAENLPRRPCAVPTGGRSSSKYRFERDAARAGVGGARRPQPVALARHRHRRQLRRESPARGAPLFRRSAGPHPPRAVARRGRHSRAPRVRRQLGRLPSERRAQRLRHARVDAAAHGGDRADFKTCAQEVAQNTVFTTHTPVDAGHDRFPPSLVDEHLEPLRQSLGLSREEFVGLGRIRPEDHNEALCMTVLAFKMSRYANGVSALHGRITRKSWQVLWPHHREDEVPVGHITNGVHVRTWLATAMQELYTQRIGADWRERLTDPEMWARINNVHDAELWETHRTLKADLVHFIRRVVSEQRRRAGYPDELVRQAETALNPDALTIGFARRFATYKRANLIFHDMPRLLKLLTNPERPVQLVFAGKAHPADKPGQEVLRRVHEATLMPELAGASCSSRTTTSTSGVTWCKGSTCGSTTRAVRKRRAAPAARKCSSTAVSICSMLDGWWAEAYDGLNGFAIGDGLTHVRPEEQDRRDGESLYQTLENEVVPLYYERDEHDVPRGWVFRMKRAIQTLGWRFNTDRMVMDYTRECYMPAAGASICSMPK